MTHPGSPANRRPRGRLGDTLKRIDDVQRQLNSQVTARTSSATEITIGGITLNGGTVSVLDTDGNVIGYLGTDPENPDNRGFVIKRPDGTTMFASYASGYEGLSYTTFSDLTGNSIIFDSPLGGIGRPYIPLGEWKAFLNPTQPLDAVPTGGLKPYRGSVTSSTTYDTLQYQFCPAYRQNPQYRWDAVVATSNAAGTGNGTCTGSVALFDGFGNQIGADIAFPNGASFVGEGPVGWPSWMFEDYQSFQLRIKRVGGAATDIVGITGTSFWGTAP